MASSHLQTFGDSPDTYNKKGGRILLKHILLSFQYKKRKWTISLANKKKKSINYNLFSWVLKISMAAFMSS